MIIFNESDFTPDELDVAYQQGWDDYFSQGRNPFRDSEMHNSWKGGNEAARAYVYNKKGRK